MSGARVVVVGLGPGGDEYVTAHTIDAITAIDHRFLRTRRHPSAHVVGEPAADFDDLYEEADTFDDVYATIVERLVAAAGEHGTVLYAVPGSPLVLERSVALLRADTRVAVEILPAISFLDLAYARLGIDPVESRLTLVDGHAFATAAAGLPGPLLVAHAHANWVLSDIKLAAESARGDEPVTILQRLGTPDEAIVETTWAELDRTVEADHLTCIYVPRLAAPVGHEVMQFHALARTLRERCPWDREQDHASLIPYLIEETYEVVDALTALDPDDPATDEALVEELGDLLYQIEFHAVIAEQQGRFSMADIARGIHDKLVRRHPHVFGDAAAESSGAVLRTWDEIKRAEKARTSVFDGVARSLPSLSYADAVQSKAAKVGFDWPDVSGAVPKIAEELDEVLAAHADGEPAAVAGEVGDLLFAVVNVARHLGVEPEVALRVATDKFRRRFEGVERLAAERAIDLRAADLTTLDMLWDEVKASE